MAKLSTTCCLRVNGGRGTRTFTPRTPLGQNDIFVFRNSGVVYPLSVLILVIFSCETTEILPKKRCNSCLIKNLEPTFKKNEMNAWTLVVLMPFMVSANRLLEISHGFEVSTEVTLRIDISELILNAETDKFAIDMLIGAKAPINFQLFVSERAVFGNIKPITDQNLIFQDGWLDFLLMNNGFGTPDKTIIEIAITATEYTVGQIIVNLIAEVVLEELAPVKRLIDENVVHLNHYPQEEFMTTYSYQVPLTKQMESGLEVRMERKRSDNATIFFAKCNLQTVDFLTSSTDPKLVVKMSAFIRLLGYLNCPTDKTKSFNIVIVTDTGIPTVGLPAIAKDNLLITIFKIFLEIIVYFDIFYTLIYVIDDIFNHMD
ncbi:unnamed protein product [Caenorhabditis sp. 36 PRJEB53466]|nr:unnamed protein product [Caenorhabditis sp. 36 PRJEB53466]